MTRRVVPGAVRPFAMVAAESVCLVLLVAVPALFDRTVERIFDEQKALLLRVAAVTLVALAPALRVRRDVWRHPVVLAAIVWLCVLAVAAMQALDPYHAWLGDYYRRHGVATAAALTVVLIALTVTARAAAARERLVRAAIIGSLMPCIYALAQAAGIDPVDWTNTVPGRVGSTAGNPLLFAGYLAVICPLTLFETIRAMGRRDNAVLHIVALVIQTGALVVTASRGPVIAVAAGCCAGALTMLGVYRQRLAVALAVAGIAVVAVGTVVLIDRTPTLFAGGSTRVRILIWQDLASAVREADWRHRVIGYGPESVRLVSPAHYNPELGRIEDASALPDRAHNEMLDALVTSGITGALAEIVLFGLVLVAALRVRDPIRRAALIAAASGHLVEIQFGIATVMSRLAFLLVAAIAVGERLDAASYDDAAVNSRAAWCGVALGGAVTGAAIWGGHVEPMYGMLALGAAIVAWQIDRERRRTGEYAVAGVAILISAVSAWPVAFTPAHADRASRAGAALEQRRNWAGAARAYGEAVSLQPREPYYRTRLGGTLTEQAREAPPHERAELFDAAQRELDRALVLDGANPYASRNLASLARRRAADTADAAARQRFVDEADRRYQAALALAPGMPQLWVEAANVAIEGRRFDSAIARLDRAGALQQATAEMWILRAAANVGTRGFDRALDAYERALTLAPDAVDALRGRAVVLAALGRNDDALEAASRLLVAAPQDAIGVRLRQSLGR